MPQGPRGRVRPYQRVLEVHEPLWVVRMVNQRLPSCLLGVRAPRSARGGASPGAHLVPKALGPVLCFTLWRGPRRHWGRVGGGSRREAGLTR